MAKGRRELGSFGPPQARLAQLQNSRPAGVSAFQFPRSRQAETVGGPQKTSPRFLTSKRAPVSHSRPLNTGERQLAIDGIREKC